MRLYTNVARIGVMRKILFEKRKSTFGFISADCSRVLLILWEYLWLVLRVCMYLCLLCDFLVQSAAFTAVSGRGENSGPVGRIEGTELRTEF